MAPVVDATDPVSRPDDDVRSPRGDLVLAARTPVGALGSRAGEATDEPLPTGIRHPLRHPAGDPREIERRSAVATAIGSGHGP
jgi:hypothetical protein